MIKFNLPKPKIKTRDEFWSERASMGRALTSLQRPCDDCAVVYGLYKDLSDELKTMDLRIKTEVSKRWFCHNHRNKSCAGNWENAFDLNK